MNVFDERCGPHTLRIEQHGNRYQGVASLPGIASDMIEDDDLDRLKRRLLHATDMQDPRYFGIDGAIRRFRSIFPEGFSDPGYHSHERLHKDTASGRLRSILPLTLARNATPAQAVTLQPVFDTGILQEAEATMIAQVLAGPTSAEFVRGAARFADGRYSEGLRAMEMATRPYGKATWPLVTYLPWLWLPGEHVLLESLTSRDLAARTGHDLAHEYEESLIPDVYRSMLDLAHVLMASLARIAPADLIDVQGFIWVVGRYPDPATRG